MREATSGSPRMSLRSCGQQTIRCLPDDGQISGSRPSPDDKEAARIHATRWLATERVAQFSRHLQKRRIVRHHALGAVRQKPVYNFGLRPTFAGKCQQKAITMRAATARARSYSGDGTLASDNRFLTR